MFSRPAFIRTEQSTIRRKPFDGSRRRWKPPGIQVANKSSVVGETGLGYHSAGSGEAPSRRTNPGCCADLAGDRTCRHWIAICRDADRSVANFYITEHFSLSLIALLLCTGCNETERFFSRVSRSRNRVSTLWFVLAEVSRKPQPQLAASAAPSLIDTSRTDGLSSHLFPTWAMNQAMEPLSRAKAKHRKRNSKQTGGFRAGVLSFFFVETKLNRESISERAKFREGRNRTRQLTALNFLKFHSILSEGMRKSQLKLLPSSSRNDEKADSRQTILF